MILDGAIQDCHHLVQHHILVFDISNALVKLAGRGQLRLQALGITNVAHQLFRRRELLGVVDNRLGFLDRQLKMTVALHFLLGVGPPFFPVLLDDIRHQRLLNLCHGSLPIVTLYNQLDQFEVPQGTHAFQPGQVGCLACEDMA